MRVGGSDSKDRGTAERGPVKYGRTPSVAVLVGIGFLVAGCRGGVGHQPLAKREMQDRIDNLERSIEVKKDMRITHLVELEQMNQLGKDVLTPSWTLKAQEAYCREYPRTVYLMDLERREAMLEREIKALKAKIDVLEKPFKMRRTNWSLRATE